MFNKSPRDARPTGSVASASESPKGDLGSADVVDVQAVILTAGEGTRISLAAPGLPKTLLQVGDAPILVPQILWLRQQGCRRIVIVHAPGQDGIIRSVTNRVFGSAGIEFYFTEQTEARGPAAALGCALPHLVDLPTVVLTADTYVAPTEVAMPPNSLGVGRAEDPSAYCLVQVRDGQVRGLIDKPHGLTSHENPPLVGLYRFDNAVLLRKVLTSAPACELAPVIDSYLAEVPLTAVHIETWEDLGNVAGYTAANRNALRGRSFHSFRVSGNGSVVKSGPKEMISRERSWFESLSPRGEEVTASLRRGGKSDELILDLLDLPTLSSLWLFEDHLPSTWAFLLQSLMDTMQMAFWQERSVSECDHVRTWCHERYREKTSRRLNSWPMFAQLSASTLRINGQVLPPFEQVWEAVQPELDRVVNGCDKLVRTHGDPTFSNVFLSRRYGYFRFIDPSSSAREAAYVGDPRYDVAKLRQCYAGNYDSLAKNLFECHPDGPDSIRWTLYGTFDPGLVDMLDDIVAHAGFDIREIRLIEALQFLSMAALHAEAPHRQLVMYCRGLSMLWDIAREVSPTAMAASLATESALSRGGGSRCAS